MIRRCILQIEVHYDDEVSTPEQVSDALDTLLTGALSTPNVLDQVGNPGVQNFTVCFKETD